VVSPNFPFFWAGRFGVPRSAIPPGLSRGGRWEGSVTGITHLHWVIEPLNARSGTARGHRRPLLCNRSIRSECERHRGTGGDASRDQRDQVGEHEGADGDEDDRKDGDGRVRYCVYPPSEQIPQGTAERDT
jgi:hypothetical protein